MGLAKVHRNGWSPEEDERLGQLITRYAPNTVARMMGRGVNSVVVRAKRLGYSRRARDGSRIDAGQLKASWHHGTKPTNKGSACWHITEQDLKAFIQKYPL
ncbi:MAG: hypothetical protein OEZ00_09920, partial [Dehalococcoidia bacterium]|nr:hypothetical protein [Dehalococcoidia bacterium]